MRSRRLHGGITAVVRAVRLDDGSVVVLRSWEDKDPEGVPQWVDNELATLAALASSPVPAPRPIAGDRQLGFVLMTRLPGRVDLAPHDLGSWATQLGGALPAIHDVRAPDPVPAFAEHHRLLAIEPHSDAHRDAIALAATADIAGDGLLHTDYQHYNVLWNRGRLTGVVDWAWPSHGAPDLDLGHCLLNAVLLFDVEVAEAIRLAYEAAVGRVSDPACVALRLLAYGPGWKTFLPRQAIGIDLDLDGMDGRLDAYLRATVSRAA